ncbi:hypothetical protein L9F63_020652 [Diploptera punctata]|uniref:Uncharacterized protein n=1 Tax=Diploptera punctata TaxID=6984 RepID=A0AAD7ZQW5_DIPPU|nr:hypothetical protein L9F63_020652 [Diploptera punctata]
MQLAKMKDVENFIQEYERVFEEYKKSYFHEHGLLKDNKSLSEQITEYKTRLAIADKDKETIFQLHKQLAEVKEITDAAHEREQNARDTLEEQKQQLNKLTFEMEQAALLGFDQEEGGASKRDRENFMKERDSMLHELATLKENLKNATKIQQELEKKNYSAELKCEELKQALESQESEMTKELRTRERLEYDVKQLTGELEINHTELENLTFQLSQAHRNMSKIGDQR